MTSNRRIVGKVMFMVVVAAGLCLLPACGKAEEPAAPARSAAKPSETVASAPPAPAPAAEPNTEEAPAEMDEDAQPTAAPDAGAAPDPAEAAAAAEAAKKGLVALPLDLPKPRFSGTPKSLPPGTRVKINKGPTRPRPPFYAPKDCKNVASKKPVTASDMEPVIGTLDLVTDGSKEAVEDAYVELGPNVQWVQIDLKDKYKIYAILTWHEHKDPRVYHDVVIQVADDKDFITNVRTVYTNDHDNSAGLGAAPDADWEFFETNEGHLVDAKGVEARYVRLYSNGSTADDLNRYTEVEVWGVPAAK